MSENSGPHKHWCKKLKSHTRNHVSETIKIKLIGFSSFTINLCTSFYITIGLESSSLEVKCIRLKSCISSAVFYNAYTILLPIH
jgi:hypothetical protein